MKKISRTGSYGIATQNGAILLTFKQSGCYKGLFDLPGGGIEANETRDECLIREFKEELGMSISSFRYLREVTHEKIVDRVDNPFLFHQIGHLYIVEGLGIIKDAIPEEVFAWHSIQAIDLQQLTPFAQKSVNLLIY